MIKAIVVEDEFLPRETLIQKLKEYHPDIEIVAQCEDAESALVEIIKQQPQLMFLDINLPKKNGIWLADQLQELKNASFTPPAIIFTTAFDDSQYMLNAIKVAAIDYLLKPILIDDLNNAIERFKNRKNENLNFDEAIKHENLLKFKNFGGLILLHIDEIAYVKADGNYTEMFLANGESEGIYERLGELETRLPEDIFLRLGKSLIVNKTFIRRINIKKCVCQLVTPQTSYDVSVSGDVMKKLKEMWK